jgi:hypothetical protein
LVIEPATKCVAIAQVSSQYNGIWDTNSSACNGRGARRIQMTINGQNNALTWQTSTGFTYVCALTGTRCAGTWSGRTGSGWFDVVFSGNSFAGLCGYGDDHSVTGTFTGNRIAR